jgi:hypothetical protein
MNELERWTNFYILMSAASATLIGLLFVVITVAAERGLEGKSKIPVYLTPTVIYFASVLFLAALLTFPNHTQFTATLCICFVGVVGVVYSGSLVGAVLLLHHPQRGLTLCGCRYAVSACGCYPQLVGHRHRRLHPPWAANFQSSPLPIFW